MSDKQNIVTFGCDTHKYYPPENFRGLNNLYADDFLMRFGASRKRYYYRAEKQEDSIIVDANQLSELEAKEPNRVFNKFAGYEVSEKELETWNSELLAEKEKKTQEKQNALVQLRAAAQKKAVETGKPIFVRQLSFYDADDFDDSERGIVTVSEYIDAAGKLSKRESAGY